MYIFLFLEEKVHHMWKQNNNFAKSNTGLIYIYELY